MYLEVDLSRLDALRVRYPTWAAEGVARASILCLDQLTRASIVRMGVYTTVCLQFGHSGVPETSAQPWIQSRQNKWPHARYSNGSLMFSRQMVHNCMSGPIRTVSNEISGVFLSVSTADTTSVFDLMRTFLARPAGGATLVSVLLRTIRPDWAYILSRYC